MINFLNKKNRIKNHDLRVVDLILLDRSWDKISVPFNFPMENIVPIFSNEDSLNSLSVDNTEDRPTQGYKLISNLLENYDDEVIYFIPIDGKFLGSVSKISRKNFQSDFFKEFKKKLNLVGITYHLSSTLVFGSSNKWALVIDHDDDFGYFGSSDLKGRDIFLNQIEHKDSYWHEIINTLILEEKHTIQLIEDIDEQKIKLWKAWLKNQINYLRGIKQKTT